MRYISVISCLLTGLIFYGCYSKGITKDESRAPIQCESPLIGYYDRPVYWNSYYPAIILKSGYLQVGVVTSYDDKGIMFLRKKTGILDNPETVFIPYEEVQTVINSSGQLEYGKVPPSFTYSYYLPVNIFVKSVSDTSVPVFRLPIVPDQSFAYCLAPGDYVIQKFQFSYTIKSVDVPPISFNISADSVNNLGRVFITPTADTSSGCVFSYKNIDEDSPLAQLFGCASRISGYFRIKQVFDDSLAVADTLPTRKTELRFEPFKSGK